MFGHFVNLALKGLKSLFSYKGAYKRIRGQTSLLFGRINSGKADSSFPVLLITRSGSCLKSNSQLPKKLFYLLQSRPAFYFILKILFVFNGLKFCPDFFGNVWKRLGKKAKINFKIDDVTTWETNNCNKNIS